MLVQFSKPVRRLITLTLVTMMMATGLMSPALTAAQNQTIQSSLTGVTISYGPAYELQEDGRNADDVIETMMFVGAADVLAMGFMTPLIDLNGARDIMLEALFGEIGSAATIDRGDYTGVSYSLDMLNIDGMEMGVFSLFMNQRSHGQSEFYIFLAPPALFGATMQTAQNSFTIDGVPLMDGVDATVMGNLVTANIGITGGTAVTDVTDVAQTPDPGPNTGQTSTTSQTGQTDVTTSGVDQGDRITYLLAITFEYATVDSAIGTIFDLLQQLDSGETDAQTVRPLVDEQYVILAGTSDRVAAIDVPAGMESFNQEVLFWSNAVTLAGTKWFDFVEGRTTSDDATEAMLDAIDIHLAFSDTLQAENMAGASDTQSTGTSGTTQTTQTSSTSSVDATTYLTTVQDHRDQFFASFLTFDEQIASLSDNATDAELRASREGTLAEADFWVTFSADAAALTAPAGYEDVHAAYLLWAESVTELGYLWIGAMNQDGTTVDQFSAQLEIVLAVDSDLESAIQASGQGGGTNAQTSGTTGDTGDATTRSTRSTGSSTAPEDTTTTSRPDRTTRTSQSTSSGNTSETSGRTRAGASATGGEWYMEQNDVTITWSDDFSLSDNAEDPQISDASIGEDKIYFQTTTSEGDRVGFNVTVYANDGSDSTGMISGLLNDSQAVVDIFGDGAEVMDSEVTTGASAVLVRASDEVGEFWVYAQVTCVTPECDTVSLVLIATEGYPLVGTLNAMESGVAIDGAPISAAIPVADVESAVDRFGN